MHAHQLPHGWTPGRRHLTTCGRCGQRSVERVTLPRLFRPLRSLGIDVRAYRCNYCDRRVLHRGERT